MLLRPTSNNNSRGKHFDLRLTKTSCIAASLPASYIVRQTIKRSFGYETMINNNIFNMKYVLSKDFTVAEAWLKRSRNHVRRIGQVIWSLATQM